MSKQIASVFWNGRSQAIRIPKEFRFAGNKVIIERDGDSIVIRPLDKDWGDDFWNCLGKASEDFERPTSTKQNREKPFK